MKYLLYFQTNAQAENFLMQVLSLSVMQIMKNALEISLSTNRLILIRHMIRTTFHSGKNTIFLSFCKIRLCETVSSAMSPPSHRAQC